MRAYRIFYRGKWSGSYREEVVFGEAELAHRLKRQRPYAIHHEVAALWRCGFCKERKPWTKEWRGVPAPGVELAKARYARNEVRVCSAECAERYHPGWTAMSAGWYYPGEHDNEPIPHPRTSAWTHRLRARWDAFNVDRMRKLATTEHRKVPMFHEKKPEGFCRWCGEAVQPPRRTWHPDCLREYFLHTERTSQVRYLRERDGRSCAAEECELEGFEVDHVTPLWRVRHLPALERLPYYGVTNLQLLCDLHHREKTAREAGERARERVDTPDG